MQRYVKTIDGKQVIKLAKSIIVIKDDLQYFNPSEEMILADGWEVYVAPVPPEPTEEELIMQDKTRMIDKINRYDISTSVNAFYVNDIRMWLDKATRVGLMLKFQSELAVKAETTSLWYEGIEFVLPINDAIQLLYALEGYASKCYNTTQQHLANVNKLTTREEINNYDYRTNYPETLRFNF